MNQADIPTTIDHPMPSPEELRFDMQKTVPRATIPDLPEFADDLRSPSPVEVTGPSVMLVDEKASEEKAQDVDDNEGSSRLPSLPPIKGLRRRTMKLPLDVIGTAGNVRKSMSASSITELADLIYAQGQQVPILVCESNEPGRYTLIAGHRRHRAMSKLDKAHAGEFNTIRAEIVPSDLHPVQYKALQLAENSGREDIGPLEEADAYYEIAKRRGYDEKLNNTQKGAIYRELSAFLGVKDKKIKTAIKLAMAPAVLRTAGEARVFIDVEGRELSKTPFAGSEPTNGLSRSQLIELQQFHGWLEELARKRKKSNARSRRVDAASILERLVFQTLKARPSTAALRKILKQARERYENAESPAPPVPIERQITRLVQKIAERLRQYDDEAAIEAFMKELETELRK